MTFQISLKCGGLLPRAERDCCLNLPWAVFGCVGVASLVMRFQACLYIVCQPGMPSACVFQIRQRIDIGESVHGSLWVGCLGLAWVVAFGFRLRKMLRRDKLPWQSLLLASLQAKTGRGERF